MCKENSVMVLPMLFDNSELMKVCSLQILPTGVLFERLFNAM